MIDEYKLWERYQVDNQGFESFTDFLLAEVKRLQKENHQQWLRIQELNEEINVWKEG